MAELRIPDRYKSGLLKVHSLSDDSFERLLYALQKCPPMVKAEDIVSLIAHEIPALSMEDLERIVTTLGSLYFVHIDSAVPVQRLASDVCDAMQSSRGADPKLLDSERAKFTNRLEKLLSVNSISYAAKAIGLRGDFACLFCDAKILTDLRPIFAKPEELPVGAVVTHTLKLGYHEGRDHKELYVSLDAGDISNLMEVLVRAQAKASSLKAFLQKTGMPELEGKS
jgi:hypothetical protein